MLTLFPARPPRLRHRLLSLVLLAVGPLTQSYGQAFRHTAAGANIAAEQPFLTILDNPLTNSLPNKLVFVSQEYGNGGPYNPHPISVFYNNNNWTIFNSDQVALAQQTKFNVLALDPADNVFVHTAGDVNIVGHATVLSHPLLNDNPNARILVTQRVSNGDVFNPHTLGVNYTGGRWVIFNQDFVAMPVGAKFNVLIENGISVVTAAAPTGNYYVFDDPATNNQLNALVFATQYWTGVYNPHEIGTWYTNNKWSVFNQDLAAMPANAKFFVYTTGSAVPAYAFTTLAGLAGSAGSVDATGSAARFSNPHGVAVDNAGNIYVADGNAHTIRKITSGRVVTTLAGLAGNAGSADGTGSNARFNNPFGVAVDGTGNVYVADIYNHTIRKITSAGVVTTLAGSAGNSGSVDATGSNARFKFPRGVAVDGAGNVYVADFDNNTIRKITSGGVVTTIAGSAGLSGSADGSGGAARFSGPSGVAVDGTGTLYVAEEFNNTIRKVTSAGLVTTVAGKAGAVGSTNGIGSGARLWNPWAVAVDSAGTNIFVADRNPTIRRMTSTGFVTTIGGLPGSAGSTDGTGSAARFGVGIFGIAVNSAGTVVVADQQNKTIRWANLASGAPAITTQPASQAVTAGASVTFSVTATGTPAPTYQWRKDGVPIPGASASSLTRNPVAVGDAGIYSVVVTSPSGTVTSNLASLTVGTTPPGSGVQFARLEALSEISGAPWTSMAELNLLDVNGTALSRLGWTVSADSEETTAENGAAVNAIDGNPATYWHTQWQAASPVHPHTFTVNLGSPRPLGGFRYLPRSVVGNGTIALWRFYTSVDGVSWTQVAQGNFADGGNHASEKTVMFVTASAPTITQQPANQSAIVGASATFAVTATGTPTPTYQWQKNGGTIAGATGASLTLNSVAVGDAGNYTVVVSNASGTVTSATAVLTVGVAPVAPTITAQPASQTVTAGASVTLSVTATGTPAPTYQWQKNGGTIAGATAASLTLNPAAVGDAGNYTVVVTNSAGTVTSATAVLSVGVSASAPTITQQPVGRTTVVGVRASFAVVATGTPAPTYQWFKDGVALPETNSFLLTSPVTPRDAGTYTVVVTNSVGSVTSTPAVLTVTPSTWLSNLSVRTNMAAGQTLIVGAVVSGGAKTILVRAAGPALNGFGLLGMADPRLDLFTSGPLPAASNDDWPASLSGTFASVGAFGFPAGSKDAALSQSINESFTVQARGTGPGVILVEGYDVAGGVTPRLKNLSARNQVGTGADILIAGLNIAGTGTKQVLIRAVGPGLTAFGVAGALVDPRVQVFTGTTLTATNDDWDAALAPTFAQVGAFALQPGSKDAALLVTLNAGTSYTVQVSGADGGTGEALVEVYEVF